MGLREEDKRDPLGDMEPELVGLDTWLAEGFEGRGRVEFSGSCNEVVGDTVA